MMHVEKYEGESILRLRWARTKTEVLYMTVNTEAHGLIQSESTPRSRRETTSKMNEAKSEMHVRINKDIGSGMLRGARTSVRRSIGIWRRLRPARFSGQH